MKDNQDKYESFVLCMMTDGQASYPDGVVKKIVHSNDIFGKMKFKAVAYAGGSSELEKMARNLKGEFVTALLAN